MIKNVFFVQTEKVSLRAHWIGFTCSRHFSSKSASAEAPTPVAAIHAVFHSLNHYNHSLEHLKSMSVFGAISSAFIFTVRASTTLLFFEP
jgi:hypothetical protein